MRPGKLRRADRAMSTEGCRRCLLECAVGHVGTVGPDGTPYVTPMHYAYDPGSNKVYFHISPEKGHLLSNLEHSPRACFEVEQAGELLLEGDEACKGGQAYRSVVCFGEMRPVTDAREKERICWLLIDKYIRGPGLRRDVKLGPVDGVLGLELDIQVMTGKERKAG